MTRGPQSIATILSELMARRGFARQQATQALEVAWRAAAGNLACQTRLGPVRRGKLEIVVSHSTLAQELTFRKPALLMALAQSVPDEKIRDLRFRVASVQ